MTESRQPLSTNAGFRDLLEAAPDAMLIADEQGRIQAVNPRCEQLFGYSRIDLLGEDVRMLLPEPLESLHRDDGPGDSPFGPERVGRRNDGTEFPVEVSHNRFDSYGRRLTISAVRDVTERRQAEAQFRALLESAPDAMVVVDAQGRIVFVNVQTERLFGFERGELLGQMVEALVPDRARGSHAAHRSKYASAARPRPMGVGLELYGRRRDGSEFPVEISLSPLETRDGLFVASAIRDITERKVAEAERARLLQERAAHAEANRVKDEFLATLSHELRTPLNAILGWIGLIENGAVPGQDVPRALATISRNARAQAQLVDDLLDVSRIVSGKLRLQRTALDLTDVADAAIEVVRPAADAKQISLEARYEYRPILVVGDADRLQQVIWNLLSNAVKFTPNHGRVDLYVQVSADHVEILVRDTGQGIPTAFLPHVFDRFRQADSTSTRPQGGLGLGLSIARSLIELHGGTIEAASSGETRGATFRVELPLSVIAERRSRKRPPPDLQSITGARVLVVDDQDDERELLVTLFERQGGDVRAAASVEAAFEIMTGWVPDLVVSDLAMPFEDGLVLVRRLRQHERLQYIPALAVTAHARPEDREAALAAGFNGYIPKPLDREALLARAASLLDGGAKAGGKPA